MKSHEVKGFMNEVEKEFLLRKDELLRIKDQAEEIQEKKRKLEDDLWNLRGRFASLTEMYNKLVIEEEKILSMLKEDEEKVVITEVMEG